MSKGRVVKGIEKTWCSKLCVWETDNALRQNPIHSKQHGFRTDKNTETAISEVTDYIIQAAFDTIKPAQTRTSLQAHNIKKSYYKMVHNYITHRNLYYAMNNECARRSMQCKILDHSIQ